MKFKTAEVLAPGHVNGLFKVPLLLEKFVGREEHQVVEGNDFQMRWVLNLVLKGQNFGWQREGDSRLTDTRSLREFSKDCLWTIMNELIRRQKSFWKQSAM